MIKSQKIKFLLLIAFISFLVWLLFQVYYYYHPELVIQIAQPKENVQKYIEQVSFDLQEKSVFGFTNEQAQIMSDIVDETFQIVLDFRSEYRAPTHITGSVDATGDKLIIVFYGNATDIYGNNQVVNIRKEYQKFW